MKVVTGLGFILCCPIEDNEKQRAYCTKFEFISLYMAILTRKFKQHKTVVCGKPCGTIIVHFSLLTVISTFIYYFSIDLIVL